MEDHTNKMEKEAKELRAERAEDREERRQLAAAVADLANRLPPGDTSALAEFRRRPFVRPSNACCAATIGAILARKS